MDAKALEDAMNYRLVLLGVVEHEAATEETGETAEA